MYLKLNHATKAALLLGAFAAHAHAETCRISIDSDDKMQFSDARINVAENCTQVELTLHHVGTMPAEVMGHNWVLTRTTDLQSVATEGMAAGPEQHYVPADDARVIAHTRVIGGGESDTITFSTAALKKGDDYTFFCSFPGHWAIMKGTLVFG